MSTAYIVIKSLDDEKTGGVLNIFGWFNQLETFGTKLIGYPKTRLFGHDHSLMIIMVETKNSERSAIWIMNELAKKGLHAGHQLFLPTPYRRMEYYTIPTLVEMFTNAENVAPYLQLIGDRMELHRLEQVYNDAELQEKFNKVAEASAPQ